jgi:hypothetical protein
MAVIFEHLSSGIYVTSWKLSKELRVTFVSRPGEECSELSAVLFSPLKIPDSSMSELTIKWRGAFLDPIEVRGHLPSKLRKSMSQHLLMGLDKLETEKLSLTADSAWRYEQLLDWGETSAVSVLADHMRVRSGTMRARLAQARLQGLLDSPGRGSRKQSF